MNISKEYKPHLETSIKNKTGLNQEYTLTSLHSLVELQKELTELFNQTNYLQVIQYLSNDFNVLLIETGYAFKDALNYTDINFDNLTKKINEFGEVPKKIMALMSKSRNQQTEVNKDPADPLPSPEYPESPEKRTNRDITDAVISKSYDYYNEITAPRTRVYAATKSNTVTVKKSPDRPQKIITQKKSQ